MDEINQWRFWVDHPTSQLFPPKPGEPGEDTPAGPQWCPESAQFLEWADTMLEKLSQDPSLGKISWAKAELQDRYFWHYKSVELDHRAEYNLDRHPCLHQAFLLILDKLMKMRLATGIPELEQPLPPGQLQRSSVRGAGGKQDAPEARIYETLLDFLENPSKLRVPEISPAIMPKEGERPAQEPDENTVQPEPNGAPVRGVDTPSQPGDGQIVFDREVQLQQRLDAAEAKLDHQRELANKRNRRWRERNPDRVRELNTIHKRTYRARQREQGS